MSRGVTEKIVSENLKNPNSIAVDWNAQNIYWVDSGQDDGKGTLEVMSVKSRKRAVLHRYVPDSRGPPANHMSLFG